MALYISNLDGALLKDNDNLSEETVEIIKRCIKIGMNITTETGRNFF